MNFLVFISVTIIVTNSSPWPSVPIEIIHRWTERLRGAGAPSRLRRARRVIRATCTWWLHKGELPRGVVKDEAGEAEELG